MRKAEIIVAFFFVAIGIIASSMRSGLASDGGQAVPNPVSFPFIWEWAR